MDVGGDGWGKQSGAWVSCLQAATKFSGRDVLVDRGEQVDAGALGLGQIERRELGFAQGELGTADYNPLGNRE